MTADGSAAVQVMKGPQQQPLFKPQAGGLIRISILRSTSALWRCPLEVREYEPSGAMPPRKRPCFVMPTLRCSPNGSGNAWFSISVFHCNEGSRLRAKVLRSTSENQVLSCHGNSGAYASSALRSLLQPPYLPELPPRMTCFVYATKFPNLCGPKIAGDTSEAPTFVEKHMFSSRCPAPKTPDTVFLAWPPTAGPNHLALRRHRRRQCPADGHGRAAGSPAANISRDAKGGLVNGGGNVLVQGIVASSWCALAMLQTCALTRCSLPCSRNRERGLRLFFHIGSHTASLVRLAADALQADALDQV
ncbi:hypothetical protein HaLaN_04515 [Haematococcus lacustris]|uniref:Uncharacterized protein n=1 Tax=Haematococcus lacustris TaxID=44745 RepID=A0A699YIT1_HAELA|nr:hypothetical protein HaLaN_04515 [Haematococcus lacustris]